MDQNEMNGSKSHSPAKKGDLMRMLENEGNRFAEIHVARKYGALESEVGSW